jgi:hypothetical protein
MVAYSDMVMSLLVQAKTNFDQYLEWVHLPMEANLKWRLEYPHDPKEFAYILQKPVEVALHLHRDHHLDLMGCHHRLDSYRKLSDNFLELTISAEWVICVFFGLTLQTNGHQLDHREKFAFFLVFENHQHVGKISYLFHSHNVIMIFCKKFIRELTSGNLLMNLLP